MRSCNFTLQCGSGSCSSSKWYESATTGLQTLQGSNLSLHAFIVSVHGPPWLHFEPLKLLNFESGRILIHLFTLTRIRIRNMTHWTELTEQNFVPPYSHVHWVAQDGASQGRHVVHAEHLTLLNTNIVSSLPQSNRLMILWVKKENVPNTKKASPNNFSLLYR